MRPFPRKSGSNGVSGGFGTIMAVFENGYGEEDVDRNLTLLHTDLTNMVVKKIRSGSFRRCTNTRDLSYIIIQNSFILYIYWECFW
jgi:hypothetical protein